jgi:hypothetical protein
MDKGALDKRIGCYIVSEHWMIVVIHVLMHLIPRNPNCKFQHSTGRQERKGGKGRNNSVFPSQPLVLSPFVACACLLFWHSIVEQSICILELLSWYNSHAILLRIL